jgi:protein-S-isoprenylcysteine O-methyltransferase Ste14
MLFKDEHDFSLLPKIVFISAISFASLLAGYLMFVDENNLISWLKPYAINGSHTRQLILMFFLVVYDLRLIVTVFVFLKRKMEWSEMLLVSGLVSFALFSFAKVGGNSHHSIGISDYLIIILYLFGSWLNTYSEYTRYVWKKDEANKGRLYTEGLFKYSMHINYFGDIILFTGFALITKSFSLLVIPLIMALNFIFFIIPRLDNYLEKKYGDQFKDYAARTKKLIPWVY